MHRSIQDRFESDFNKQFAQDLEWAEPQHRPASASSAAGPQNQPAQQLSFVFAMPGSEPSRS
jgi:hypothetical protein